MTGTAASFVPGRPERILVLAHGFPWPDGSQPDSCLAAYAQAAVERWAPFAQAHHAILLAPVLGGQEFPRYQEMLGRAGSPGAFVNQLADEAARAHLPRFGGRMSLHGHSAGAQFAARYLVTHPGRLNAVILGAPSTLPVPDPGIPWPYGMGAPERDRPAESRPAAGQHRPGVPPASARWLAAASEVRVTVLTGSRDTEPRPPAPGQHGSTRIERAAAWTAAMRRYAQDSGRPATVRFTLAEGLDHDEEAAAAPAQDILACSWDDPGTR